MMPSIQHDIIVDTAQFIKKTQYWKGAIACDVETAKNTHLLGVALSNGVFSVYVPITEWTGECFRPFANPELHSVLANFLKNSMLIGHNFTYDKGYIDEFFKMDSKWLADTRIMWHLASAPSGPRPYGLKDAQIEVLGWEKTNEEDLKKEVESHNGKLSKGDHYLASLATLARYACLDVYSTYRIFVRLKEFFDKHDYYDMMSRMMQYNLLLERNTREGVKVDVKGLGKAHDRLLKKKDAAERKFRRLLSNEISQMEEDWADRKSCLYKRESNKLLYQAHPEKWKRFNINSDSDKRELFFDRLRLESTDSTDSGLPSTSSGSIANSARSHETAHILEAMEAYFTYEKSNTISGNFSGPYLDVSRQTGRLHPGFNICGTVSYRLSGFKPYLLNAPFDEKYILKHLKVDEGNIGIHADLSAIEPTVTAHYSQDPTLLKVFRDGLGDIYLDLALELFPTDMELQRGYNPNILITKEVKERFKKQRDIAKVIQLAVQYTGTEYTVKKNLDKEGFSVTLEQARALVQAYWRKFKKVAEMNQRLFALNRKQGFLVNPSGRIIRVPEPTYKDLPNRFIQSSAHDVLIMWVMEIYEEHSRLGLPISPVLLDCHDSTSNAVPEENKETSKEIYEKALQKVNDMLGLTVKVRAEMKEFSTLAGLKGNE